MINKYLRVLCIYVSCTVVLLGLAGCNTTNSTTHTKTTTNINSVNSASSQSANGLSLSLSLDSKTYLPGREVSIVIAVKNTLSIENDVSVSDNWSYSNLGLGPCDIGPGGFGYPYGVAVFQGDYTSSNLSSATPLSLYDYSVIVPCPGPMPSAEYDFKPLSDIATVLSSASSFPNSTYAVNFELTEAGYWTGVSPGVTKHDFAPGVYTVVAGDEWGSLVLLHFTVSQDITGGNSATSLSPIGLKLSLSLDSTIYQPGQQVTIVIVETNTLSKTNIVSISNKWSYSYLTLGQCGTYLLPFGVALLQGYYSSTNISTATPATPLMFYDYNVQPCPIVLGKITTYDFKPSSDIATIQYESQPGTQPIKTNVTFSLQLTGYWTGSPPPIKKNFEPGDYPVVAGDEWGNLVVLHFTVS